VVDQATRLHRNLVARKHSGSICFVGPNGWPGSCWV
jgi:hypothetical protein